ncbi:MAG: hypothetical protein M3340_01260 [Actinomycetota bacterium]|nr:hypothetical protein [Actinomycetota bacterium]
MSESSGPHLTAALICERVLTEQDGVASAIRIIDRVFLLLNEENEPIQKAMPFTVMVSFKSGSARGSYTVKLRMEKPSGEEVPLLEAPVLLEGEERGVNLIFEMVFEPDQAGLYWLDVLFESDRVTRIPLRVVYQTQPVAGRGG